MWVEQPEQGSLVGVWALFPFESLSETISSLTLVGEGDRKMLKAVIKRSTGEDNIRHRIIPADVLTHWAKKVESLRSEITSILQEEKEEKQVRLLLMTMF